MSRIRPSVFVQLLLAVGMVAGLSAACGGRQGDSPTSPPPALTRSIAQLPAQGSQPILQLNPADPQNPQGALDTSASLVHAEVRLIGDNNADGTVSFADVNGLVATFGQSVDGSTVKQAHDFNGDGEVNFADVNLLVAAFGTSVTEIRRYQYQADFDPATAPLLGSYPLSDVIDSAAQPTQSGYLPIAVPVDLSAPAHEEVFLAAGEVAGTPFVDPADPVPILISGGGGGGSQLNFNIQVVETQGEIGGTAGVSLKEVDGRPAMTYYFLNENNPPDQAVEVHFAINTQPDGSGSWQIGSIFASDSVGGTTSLAIVDGRPAVSFFDGSNRTTLMYAINRQADGQGQWDVVTVAPPNQEIAGMVSELTVVGGKPAICYRIGQEEFRVAVSTTTDGLGSWNISTVTTGAGQAGSDLCSIAEVQGKPAVAYTKNGQVFFALNSQSDGTGSWQTQEVTQTIEAGGSIKLYVVDNKPAVIYTKALGVGLVYAYSSQSDGLGSWDLVLADESDGFTFPSGLDMTVVDNKPVVSFFGGGTQDNQLVKGIKLARATQANGQGSWLAQMVDTDDTIASPFSSIAVINGKIAIAYHTLTDSKVKFAIQE